MTYFFHTCLLVILYTILSIQNKIKPNINDNLNMYINDHLRMYTSDYALI